MLRATTARTPGALALVLTLVLALGGCYEAHLLDRDGTVEGPFDGGAGDRDAGARDGGSRDSGIDLDADIDASVPPLDGGPLDSGPRDGGPFDAGIDAGVLPFDGGPLDGGPLDAGIGPRDSGPRDSGPRDSGVDARVIPLDGGSRDGGSRDGGGPRDSGIILRDSGLDASRPDAGPDGGGYRSIALEFGLDDRLFVPDRPGLSVGPNSTIELWVRARGPGIVSSKGQAGGQQHFMIRIEGTGDATELVAGWVNVALERRELRVPFAGSLGRWTHVAFVIDPPGPDGRLRALLYVDLELVATAELPDEFGAVFNIEGIVFGRFLGDLDDIRIWSSARSQDALRGSAFRRLRAGTAGLVAYWPLEEFPAGQIALDRSLRGNDAILGDRTAPDARDPLWITDGPFP